MADVLVKVRSFTERHSMFDGARGVVVAVSGGPDSIALLDLLLRLLATEKKAEGQRTHRAGEDSPLLLCSFASLPSIHVAHLDHGLRTESGEDAEFVRSLAVRLGLPVTIETADVRGAAEAWRRGIEETARELRYRFLVRAAQQAGYDRIATGHTMNDQAETFLMRLARGSGLRGLASMQPVSLAPQFGADAAPLPLRLVRPLLCLAREEVELYCRERGLESRSDPSNTWRDYTRNRVRHDLLPLLASINPRIVRTIARTAEIIAADDRALEATARSALEASFNRRGGADRLPTGGEPGSSAYMVAAFVEQPEGVRRRMIREAMIRARRPAQRIGTDSRHLAAVEQLLEDGSSGKRVLLGGGLEVWREFDALVFRESAGAHCGERQYECRLSETNLMAEAGGLSISLARGQAGRLLSAVVEEAKGLRVRTGRNWTTAALDDGALPAELVLRPRRPGERALVVGHDKTKKLKKLMIDHRIPTSRRAIWPVVATPDGRYVWSPGLPPAVEFAARDETHGLAILRAAGF